MSTSETPSESISHSQSTSASTNDSTSQSMSHSMSASSSESTNVSPMHPTSEAQQHDNNKPHSEALPDTGEDDNQSKGLLSGLLSLIFGLAIFRKSRKDKKDRKEDNNN